eukprot:403356578
MADNSFQRNLTSDNQNHQVKKKAFYESDSDEEAAPVQTQMQPPNQGLPVNQQTTLVAQSRFSKSEVVGTSNIISSDPREETKSSINNQAQNHEDEFQKISTLQGKDQTKINTQIIPQIVMSDADKLKMSQLENTINEYKTQMSKLERLLKEDQDLINDPDKKEEAEKIRDQLSENLILQLNELKFLQNQQVTLSKKIHSDRVCEGYFSSEKTWYAALILEIFEETQEAEVAWIGYKSQEKLNKKFLNVLFPPNPNDLFEGALCNAVFAQDGMWYPCVVEKIVNDEKNSNDVSPELNAILSKYLVKFKHNQVKATVPLDYIRITRDQMITNATRRQQILNGDDEDQIVGDFAIPEHLRLKRGDTEKAKLQKRKKVKALKYTHKVKIQEVDSKARQSTWLDFTNKAVKQKQGHFATAKNTESIFKSPDTVMGKVGVVGSGKTMTAYETQKIKYHEKLKNEGPSDDFREIENSQSFKRSRFN